MSQAYVGVVVELGERVLGGGFWGRSGLGFLAQQNKGSFQSAFCRENLQDHI